MKDSFWWWKNKVIDDQKVYLNNWVESVLNVENLPSELDDFSASVCAANAFVRSNKSSWNCLESVVVDKSTDLKILKI